MSNEKKKTEGEGSVMESFSTEDVIEQPKKKHCHDNNRDF
jgi:hypothetical protein